MVFNMVGNNLSEMTSKKNKTKPNKNAALLIKIVPGFVRFFLLAVHREVVYFVYLCVLSLSLPDVSVSLSSVLAGNAKRFAFSSLTRTSKENNVRAASLSGCLFKKNK